MRTEAKLAIVVVLTLGQTLAKEASLPVSLRQTVARAIGAEDATSLVMTTAASLSHELRYEVAEAARDHSTGDVRVRVRCVPSNACLPFLVLVRGAGECSGCSARRLPMSKTARKPFAVHAGDRGVFERSSATMKITVPVVALGAGGVGEVVRVRIGPRQVVRVRVVAAGVFGEVRD